MKRLLTVLVACAVVGGSVARWGIGQRLLRSHFDDHSFLGTARKHIDLEGRKKSW